MERTVEVIFSPLLLNLYDLKSKQVVVIDILRATSTICAALHKGAKSIIPVMDLEDALQYQEKGYITGGERNGIKIESFDLGNSPREYDDFDVMGRDIVLTTTNGTKCVELSKRAGAKEIYAGSFFNAQVLAEHLLSTGDNVILFCAGWKNRVNMEDSLFAGYMIQLLSPTLKPTGDSSQIALGIANSGMDDPVKYLEKASHAERFKRLGVTDLPYCLQRDIHPTLARLEDGSIVHK